MHLICPLIRCGFDTAQCDHQNPAELYLEAPGRRVHRLVEQTALLRAALWTLLASRLPEQIGQNQREEKSAERPTLW